METIACSLALIVGTVALVAFYSKKSNTLLLIGTGFFGTALLDGYHTFVTSEWFAHLLPSPPTSLIPWSWNASRVFLAILMFLSWWTWRKETRLEAAGRIREGTVYLIVGSLTAMSFVFFAFVPLPRAYYPELPFGRPEEFVSAGFFLIALVGYLKKGQWKSDPFEHCVILSLLVAFMGQAMFMSASYRLFDAMFDMAHLLKVVSYLFVLTGLFINMHRLFSQAENSAQQLSQVNVDLENEITQRRQTEKKLRHLAETLEERVKERTGELKTQQTAALNIAQDANEARERALRAEEEVRKLNKELEQRVLDRTTQLLAANKELEAFTYSVSHDLRAPLRHIDGFANILALECGGQLDANARHYLERVCEGTRQMGTLVDDLLSFSQLGRQELCRQATGLNSLVKEVQHNLQPEIQGRTIEWQIGQLPFADCDPVLVKHVFFNLLSNAVKYTRPRAHAVIQVGQTEQNGESVIFVRDNGVGFSMKYGDKLFGIFQRLHRAEDFEGTGVGLATVHRIIQKHGGRVWAEAELDKGATFYFSLGTPEDDEAENGTTKAERS